MITLPIPRRRCTVSSMNSGPTIFFSWQSDTPSKVNRTFIRSCLDKAAKHLVTTSAVEDAFRVDAGLEGVSGSPEVASTIFEKIDASSLFVGDLTLVASGDLDDSRRSPNLNVSIEMGYAAATLGWDRIICVMNEDFGKPAALPFDYKNKRFPITFTTKEQGSKIAQTRLVLALKSALIEAEQSEWKMVSRAVRRLDLVSVRVIHKYSSVPWFSEPNTVEPGEPDWMTLVPQAIRRLLDLDLVYADFNSAKNLYAYHWTYLGKKVIERIVSKES